MTDLINELVKDLEDFLLEVDKMVFAPLQRPSKPISSTSTPTARATETAKDTVTSSTSTSTSNSAALKPSNVVPTGQWAYWAPDAWAGKPPSQWRKFPLNQLNIGYTYNPWGVVFAYPERYPTTLKQLEFLNYWNSPLQKWIEEHGLESQELALFGIG